MIPKTFFSFFIWYFFQVYFHTYIWVLMYWFSIQIYSEICIFNTTLFVPKWTTPIPKIRKWVLLDTHICSSFLMDSGQITDKNCMKVAGIFCIIRTARAFLPTEPCWNHSSRFRRKGKTGSFRLHMGCNFAHHVKKLKPKKDASVFSDSLKLSPCSAVSALPVMSISTNITGFCSFAANLPYRFINVTLMAVLAITTLTSRGWYTLKAWVDYLSLKESFSILIKLARSQQKSTNAYHRQHRPSLDSAL